MTQDDCNNSRSDVGVSTEERHQSSGSEDSSWVAVDFTGTIEKTLWDAALASADDALVLVQWLESKRS
jgi:hypothetical protein